MKVFDPGMPTAILKADDLGMGLGIGLNCFRRLSAIIADRKLCLSIGAVGSLLQTFPRRDLAFFRGVFEDDSFELWNHSNRHLDLTTLPREAQLADTLRAQDNLERMLGRRPRIYGAPYNRVDANTIAMLEECGEFDGAWMLDWNTTRLFTIPLTHLCTPETVRDTSRQPEFEPFRTRWAARAACRPTIVQFHPTAWNDEGFEAFGRCLDWLIAQNVRFLTFADAVTLGAVVAAPAGIAPRATSSRVLTVAADIQGEAVVAAMPPETFTTLSRDFFATRYQLGTQRSMRALAKSGILHSLAQERADRILDIGFGVGNWMIAAASLAPGAEVHGVDPHPGCGAITSSVLERLAFTGRISAHSAPAERLPFPDEHFAAAYCINSINYMDIPVALTEVWRVVAANGALAINTQSRAYFLGSAQALLKADANDAARSRLETLAYQAGYSLGFTRAPIRTRTYQAPDVFRMLRVLGFDVLVERASLEEGVTTWNGEPYVDAFVAQRSSDRLRNLRGQIAKKDGTGPLGVARQLFGLGCHALLLEATTSGLFDRVELEEHDLPAMSSLALDRIEGAALMAAEGSLRTQIGRVVFRMQQRDWIGAAMLAKDAENRNISYLGALALHMAGNHDDALSVCRVLAQPDEPRFAYLAAAAACRTGKLEVVRQVAESGILQPWPGEISPRPFAVEGNQARMKAE